MKLYGSYTSPYVRHCRIALMELGQEWTMIETDQKASAKASPSQKVPFLEDGDIRLTDSCTILRYIREKQGRSFCPDIMDYEKFCLTNTLLDASVNLLLMERDGIKPDDSPYLKRQQSRVETGLDALNQYSYENSDSWLDSDLRLACFLDWATFRNRFSWDDKENLVALVDWAKSYDAFVETSPPRS